MASNTRGSSSSGGGRGFASMSKEEVRRIGAKGGRASRGTSSSRSNNSESGRR